MAKELIISANVHEKKVAILEDGLVTEFYVERRDENQGVVGNLYKGRVMKVLPGMQSAFVDIGLERDAFLYVSDFTEFMEEEDEIEFKELPDEPRGGPGLEDHQRRPDRRRPDLPPPVSRPAQERPLTAVEAEKPMRLEDAVEQLAEIADERVLPVPAPEEDSDAALASSGSEIAEADVAAVDEFVAERITDELPEGELVAGRAIAPSPAGNALQAPQEDATETEPASADPADAEPQLSKSRRGRGRKKPGIDGDHSEAALKKGTKATESGPAVGGKSALAKGAAKSPPKRGSRRRGAPIDDGETTAEPALPAHTFERVTDEDIAQDAGDLLKDAIVQEKIIEQVHTAEYQTAPMSLEPEPEWRVGSFRSDAGEPTFQRVIDETNDRLTESQSPSAGLVSGDRGEESEGSAISDRGRPFRHIGEVLSGEAYGSLRSEMGRAEGLESESGQGGEAVSAGAAEEGPHANHSRAGSETPGEGDHDREAGVYDRGGSAEFAVRRGSRGRRGRRRDPNDPKAPGAPAAGLPAPVNAAAADDGEREAAPRGPGEAVIAEPPVEPVKAEVQPRPPAPRHQDGRGDRRPESYRRPEQDRRGDQDRRPDQGPGRRGERSAPPTISELLHEGQEILVQIAKEPIAKKGARITSHIALPGRYLVYMPTVNHVGVSRKIPSEIERLRLKRIVTTLRERENGSGGFIARTACAGHTEQELHDDMRYLLRTWADVRKKAERVKAPALVHKDLDLVQRILRDQLSEEYSAIRVDSEIEYAQIVEFVNRVQPKLVKRVKLYGGTQPIFEKYGVQPEIDKAVRPRVWLKSGGYIVINQTEALVAIDVNTGKFVGKSDKLEDTITRTNLEAAKEIVRQIRLRDLGGIIVLDLIDMEERKNRQRVMTALQQELQTDRAPSKILSINDFGLVAITRKRVKQSLERTLCTPCPYCQGAGMVKSAQTMCFEILDQAKGVSKQLAGRSDVMLRVSPHVAEALRSAERAVFDEIEAHFGMPVTIEPDPNLHQEQFDFAVL